MGTIGKAYGKGQSTIEYALLIAIVISALLAIQMFVKQATMGRLRAVTDQQFGRQWDPFNVEGTVVSTSQTHRNETTTVKGTSTSILSDDENTKREWTGTGEDVKKTTSKDLTWQ